MFWLVCSINVNSTQLANGLLMVQFCILADFLLTSSNNYRERNTEVSNIVWICVFSPFSSVNFCFLHFVALFLHIRTVRLLGELIYLSLCNALFIYGNFLCCKVYLF